MIEGVKERRYHMDDKDAEISKKTKQCGSVVGIKFDVIHNNITLINAMLCFTTYSKNMAQSDTLKKTEENLEIIILPQFVSELQVELTLDYLERCYKESQTQ